jgi:hypothetical protein
LLHLFRTRLGFHVATPQIRAGSGSTGLWSTLYVDLIGGLS